MAKQKRARNPRATPAPLPFGVAPPKPKTGGVRAQRGAPPPTVTPRMDPNTLRSLARLRAGVLAAETPEDPALDAIIAGMPLAGAARVVAQGQKKGAAAKPGAAKAVGRPRFTVRTGEEAPRPSPGAAHRTCSVCGFEGRYTCVRCNARLCGPGCRGAHGERCGK